MPQPPQLSAEQRQAALDKAAKVRRERAEVKELLKMGSIDIDELFRRIEQGDDVIGGIRVLSLLESLPRLGKVKAKRLLEECDISESRRAQGLGTQQRQRLYERLKGAPEPD